MKVFLHLVIALLAASVANADVRLSMRDGRIAIVAKDATVAEILAQWARIGRTIIVNADRLPADLVSLELQNVSEQQALDVLLRGTSGYLAVPRAVADPSASLFDRIAIMPPSVPPPAATVAATAPHSRAAPAAEATPVISQPALPTAPGDSAEAPPNDASSDEPSAPTIIGAELVSPQVVERQTTFTSRQMLEVANPRDFKLPSRPAGAASAAPPGAFPPVIGVAVPGMIASPLRPEPGRSPRQPPIR